MNKFILLILATFFVVTCFAYYNLESKHNRLYHIYLEKTAPPIFQTRANMVLHTSPIMDLHAAILQHDYDKSLALCNLLLDNPQFQASKENILLLSAYTLLQKKEVHSAQDFLFKKGSMALDKEQSGAAAWLLALSYLHSNNIEKCKEYLSLTQHNASLYSHLAIELQALI